MLDRIRLMEGVGTLTELRVTFLTSVIDAGDSIGGCASGETVPQHLSKRTSRHLTAADQRLVMTGVATLAQVAVGERLGRQIADHRARNIEVMTRNRSGIEKFLGCVARIVEHGKCAAHNSQQSNRENCAPAGVKAFVIG